MHAKHLLFDPAIRQHAQVDQLRVPESTLKCAIKMAYPAGKDMVIVLARWPHAVLKLMTRLQSGTSLGQSL